MRRVGCGLLVLVSAAARAWAQSGAPEDACIRAAEDGQRSRSRDKLRDARAAFETCAKRECPAEVVARCTDWLAETVRATPTFVVSAQDARGKDLTGGSVTLDGAHVADALSGRAIAVDPGTHTIELRAAEGGPVREIVVVHEGQKDRLVVLRLPELAPSEPMRAKTSASRPVPWTVWAAGALGVAGAGVFVGFGSAGLYDRDRSGCASGCARADASRVGAELAVADVGLAVAVAWLAAAAALWLVRPTVVRTAWLAAPPWW